MVPHWPSQFCLLVFVSDLIFVSLAKTGPPARNFWTEASTSALEEVERLFGILHRSKREPLTNNGRSLKSDQGNYLTAQQGNPGKGRSFSKGGQTANRIGNGRAVQGSEKARGRAANNQQVQIKIEQQFSEEHFNSDHVHDITININGNIPGMSSPVKTTTPTTTDWNLFTKLACNSSHTLDKSKFYVIHSPNFGTKTQYPPSSSCSWEFKGGPNCVPAIRCEELDLRPEYCADEHIRISDQVGGTQKLCGNQGFVFPKKGTKNSPNLSLLFHADKATKFSRLFKGFRCKIRCAVDPSVPKELPNPNVITNTKTNTTSACDGKQLISKGKPTVLQSPNFGKNIPYPFNAACSYTIETDESCADGMQVVCPEMDIRTPCTLEFVKIKDSSGKETVLCGKQALLKPQIDPAAKSMTISFLTADRDPSNTFYKGWKCRFSCAAKQPPPRETKCDGTYQLADKRALQLQSPYFGMEFEYPPNSQCTYVVLGDRTCDVSVTCPEMEVRDCARGEYLLLEAADGKQRKLCNKETLKQPIVSTKITLTARTVANPKITTHFKGWKCDFKCVAPPTITTTTTKKPTTTTTKKPTMTTTKKPTTTTKKPTTTKKITKAPATTKKVTKPPTTLAPLPPVKCGKEQMLTTSSNPKIYSPNYYQAPKNYPPGATCVWNFPANCVLGVEFKMEDLDLRFDPNCEEEYVELEISGYGKSRHCNQDKLLLINRTPPEPQNLKVTFKSSPKREFDRHYKGFLMELGCLDKLPSQEKPIPVILPGLHNRVSKCPNNKTEVEVELPIADVLPSYTPYTFTSEPPGSGYPPNFKCTHIFKIPAGCIFTFNCGEPTLRVNEDPKNKCPDEYVYFEERLLKQNESVINAKMNGFKMCGNESYQKGAALFIDPRRTATFSMEFVTRKEPLPEKTKGSFGFTCKMWCFKSVEELRWANEKGTKLEFPDGRPIPHQAGTSNKGIAFREFYSQTTLSSWNEGWQGVHPGAQARQGGRAMRKYNQARSFKGQGGRSITKGQRGRSSAKSQRGRSSAKGQRVRSSSGFRDAQ